MLAQALLVLLLGRPWFAAAAVAAFILLLVQVNNAKMHSLREAFVFQDYEYFTDAILHPRLYIPFLGWWKFLAAVVGFALAVVVGLYGEDVPAHRFDWHGQLGGVALLLLSSMLLLWLGKRQHLPVSLQPEQDIFALGFLACLWRYAEAERVPPQASSPFSKLEQPTGNTVLPHLVAVQSESFFDARRLFSGIRADVLQAYDLLKQDAASHGALQVPAWGANTVRSEFAFLSGIEAEQLGVHRFNPYRTVAAGWGVASLASYLKQLGYRTVCIHPYPASFYRRDRVYPRFGFDEFLDIRHFDESMRAGPYTGDMAVADRIAAILGEAKQPVFIFAITMENHGPLHLEQQTEADISALYHAAPPAGCEDLTIYLRHLRNADRMIHSLRQTLAQCPQPASLCWYGDHVPIMPAVYQVFGVPDGAVEYVLWANRTVQCQKVEAEGKTAQSLARDWLQMLGLA
ncbi:LTA synthase family protein [Leeia oryzae]|uniref:LTA synthase family protein n=1 Tax=Leeia oryzae TaxID=356662 RepID=UPI001B7FCEDD|nr:LTA synthase family protein [Leeia oryzae]